MAVKSTIFKQKSPHKFSDTDPSNHLISRSTQFEQPFSLENAKKTILRDLSLFLMYFKFQVNLAEVSKWAGYVIFPCRILEPVRPWPNPKGFVQKVRLRQVPVSKVRARNT